MLLSFFLIRLSVKPITLQGQYWIHTFLYLLYVVSLLSISSLCKQLHRINIFILTFLVHIYINQSTKAEHMRNSYRGHIQSRMHPAPMRVELMSWNNEHVWNYLWYVSFDCEILEYIYKKEFPFSTCSKAYNLPLHS